MFNDVVENTLCQIAFTFPCSFLSATQFHSLSLWSKLLPEGGMKKL